VYHGVHPAFRDAPRWTPERPYVLSVAEYGPRKGFEKMFAVARGLAEHGYPHRLRVAGRIAPWVEPITTTLRRESGAPEQIELLGHVDHLDELPRLYAGASVLVSASETESFGLPLAEAMAAGTPIVAFRNSSFAEIVGDGGVMVPDGDVPALLKAVTALLDDPRRWEEVSTAGRERSRRFDWATSAATHAEIFRDVASRRG
jgi:glycosyltransferase involved in cell wall biosynthesis